MPPAHNHHQDDANVRVLADEDQQQLLRLVQRYGIPSIICALTSSPASSGASTVTSAPSLVWTGSDVSNCKSDNASIHNPCAWPEASHEIQPICDLASGKISDRSWLDSTTAEPSPVPSSDLTLQASPQLLAPTNKKYQCPMCFLDNSPVGFGRKSDFKKHLHNFHGTDIVWICRSKACHLTFSTERAYSTHAKDIHRMKALPTSTARTELCAQFVFACGFASCKDRLFEAHSSDEGSSAREKYFEHIAKHFEEGLDIKQWEYRIEIQNLMRQPKVKPVWKTCIWPKEKRQQLHWRPRSSGDLKRMLECRHLGEDVSDLVRLAFILGTAPFTTSTTPPPAEIDTKFLLPYRNQCPNDSPRHNYGYTGSSKSEEDASSTLAPVGRRASITQSVFRISGGRNKRSSPPPTPRVSLGSSGLTSVAADASVCGLPRRAQAVVQDDLMNGPHPGTPFPIPTDVAWPIDAPKFAPEIDQALPKQLNASVNDPMMYSMRLDQNPHGQLYALESFDPYQQSIGMSSGFYDYSNNTCLTPLSRPATPAPHKRPASWSRVVSMEGFRPAKKAASHGAPVPSDMVPTLMGL